MSTRWSLEQVLPVLTDEGPRGMVDLWNAIPAGASAGTTGMAALVNGNQNAIAARIATLQQQVSAAVGVTSGYRPEILPLLSPVLERGAAAQQAAAAILLEGLELAGVFEGLENLAAESLGRVLTAVADGLGIVIGAVAVVPYIGQVVAVVLWVVRMVSGQVASEREAARIAELVQRQCKPVVYSAAMDGAWADEAVAEVVGGDWTRIFLPETRLRDPDYSPWPGLPYGPGNDGVRGPTCCPSALDRFTVIIAPIGVGLGSRLQNFVAPVLYPGQTKTGLGCLPMLPQPVHRAFTIARGVDTLEAGRDLPELGSVGGLAWRSLWARGPATWAVDAGQLSEAWREYIEITVRTIATNPRINTVGGGTVEGVCAEWRTDRRLAAARNIALRFGARAETAAPDGIHTFDDALPVVAWADTERYQAAMLERVTVFYADANTCSPAWRARLEQAQRDGLTSDLVCDVELDGIANSELREAVYDEQRRRGVVCYAIAGKDVQARGPVGPTSGPSTEPLGSSSPALPDFPELPKPERLGSSSSSTSSSTGEPGALGLALGAAAVGFGLWAASRWLGKGKSNGLR